EAPGDSDGVVQTWGSNQPIDHAKMVTRVHGRGGLVIINHPALRGYKWPEGTFGADLCEVNGTWDEPSGKAALAWWVRRLLAKERIGAIGGSDFHAFRPKRGVITPKIDEPINLIYVEKNDQAGVFEALRARHVQVLRTLSSPRCTVALD